MAYCSLPMPQPRLLLIGPDPAWMGVVGAAATRIGAPVDVQPDVAGAIAWMLPPSRIYSHVLATVPLTSQEIDALAGMLDEVTLAPTPLLLLGSPDCGSTAVRCVHRPDEDALILALRSVWRAPPEQPPLSARDLAASLHGGGLRMRFQPILRAADLRPVGMEALARVHHPVRGILHPRDFIPLAVASRQERVLTSIAAVRSFLEMRAGLLGPGMYMTLNLPMVTLLHKPAVLRGLELCAVAGLTPERIVLEVLESSTPPDLPAMGRAMEAWRNAGFRLAIDDAGPALPHWRALLDLPFDILKLDGGMVADMCAQDRVERIASAAHARGMSVIAEGIEDTACLARIRGLGVAFLQGFLFSRPLPSLAVPVWLRQWNPATLSAASVRAA